MMYIIMLISNNGVSNQLKLTIIGIDQNNTKMKTIIFIDGKG